jgi:hypothetical protein
MRTRRIGMVAALALLAAACATPDVVPEASGPSEGIAVHGDWTIDVLNADGSLDRRAEFSNALQVGGAEGIVRLLAGERSSGGNFTIALGDFLGEGPCPSDSDNLCLIEVVGSVVEDGGLPDTLRLSGSTVVEEDSGIFRVITSFQTCGSGTSPSECAALGYATDVSGLTIKHLAPEEEVPVFAGQIVQVQVDISFTSS